MVYFPAEIITFYVSGEGIVADLYKDLIHIFKPLVSAYDINSTLCLPHPHSPDYRTYLKILGLIAMFWTLLIAEPYGLRLRLFIMEEHYPRRCIERTYFLHNRILNKRLNFVKFARHKMQQIYFGEDTKTCIELLRAKAKGSWICRMIFGTNNNLLCMLCSRFSKSGYDLVTCETEGCLATYCTECFNDLNGTCSLCQHQQPIDYSDVSDISEEK